MIRQKEYGASIAARHYRESGKDASSIMSIHVGVRAAAIFAIVRESMTGKKPHMATRKSWRKNFPYFTRPLLTVMALGFSSGLPLALTASTLSAWLSDAHVDKAAIGLFAAVGIPYSLKFLWSPLIDSLSFPVLTKRFGRRRGWMLATQAALAAALLLLAAASPVVNPWATAAAALLVAFLSASQDIVIDAYRIESLDAGQQGEGAAMIQLGYRLGMLVSSAGGLYLAAKIGWPAAYMAMAGFMGVGAVTVMLAPEPKTPRAKHPKDFLRWLQESVIAPLKDFAHHPSWAYILGFIAIYKLADAFIGNMTNPFLLETGFKKEQIAAIVKVYGTGATLLGIFAGGSLTARLGALRVLFIAGLLHGCTNLCYVWQAYAGTDTTVLAIGTSLENFTGGVAASGFVAYLSNLCNVHYTATQYALMSSLAALARTLMSTPAGQAAKYLGWKCFFAASATLALPGLVLILLLERRLAAKR
jgi:PAT family beta-lactamase induction signal transducer AmpG